MGGGAYLGEARASHLPPSAFRPSVPPRPSRDLMPPSIRWIEDNSLSAASPRSSGSSAQLNGKPQSIGKSATNTQRAVL